MKKRIGTFFILILLTILQSPITSAQPPIQTCSDVIDDTNATQVDELARLGRGSIRDIDVHPDGNLVAVASGGGVWLYNLADGSEQIIGGEIIGAQSVEFSPDGEQLVTGLTDGSLLLWQVGNWESPRLFAGEARNAVDVEWSSTGDSILSAGLSSDFHIYEWDVETGNIQQAIEVPSEGVTMAKYSPVGSLALVGAIDGLYIADLQTGMILHDLGSYYLISADAALWLADSKTVITGNYAGTLHYWDVETGTLLHSIDALSSGITTIEQTSTDLLVVGSNNGEIGIWDIETWEPIAIYQHLGGRILQASLSDHNTATYFTVHDGLFEKRATDTPEPLWSRFSHFYGVDRVALSEDGSLVLGEYYSDGVLILWDTQTQSIRFRLDIPHAGIWTMALDDQHIYALSGLDTLWTWDIETGDLVNTFKGDIEGGFDSTGMHADAIRSGAFSRDLQFVATGLGNGGIHIRKTANGEIIQTIRGHERDVVDLAFSPDGHYLWSASYDNSAGLWEIDTGIRLHSFPSLTEYDSGYSMSETIFSPDGQYTLNQYGPLYISLIDVVTGTILYGPHRMVGGVSDIAWSPASNIVLLYGTDNHIRLWNPATYEFIQSLPVYSSLFSDVTWSGDGTRFATASKDGIIHLWGISCD